MTACTASAACSPLPSGTARQRRLLLARDRLGVKPLYWALVPASAAQGRGERLLFASEIKSHPRQRPDRSARPNDAVLPELLATR